MIIAAANTGTDEELEDKYHIQLDSKTPQYRLFVKGRDIPFVNNMNEPRVLTRKLNNSIVGVD